MSARKKHNMQKRMQAATGALLRQHGVCVVNIDPIHRQGLMSWKTLKNVRHSRQMANAICDFAHEWVIYIGAICRDQLGQEYIKQVEIAPIGRYRSDDLEDVIESQYKALLETCNRMHVVGSGWIANPCGVSLTEDQAAKIFEAAGAWSAENIAASELTAHNAA